jgi:hypothetical protein
MSNATQETHDGYLTVRVSVDVVTRLNTIGARLQFRASEARGVRVSRTAVIEELLDCWDESHPQESSQPKQEKPKKKTKDEAP